MNKRFMLLVIISTLIISGCQPRSSAVDEASTMVAQTVVAAPPTNTPEPTFTPLPTDTPTPLPTATMDVGATATAQASTVLSELSGLVGDEIPYKDGSLAWQQTEPITIEMSGPQATDNFREIDKSLTAGNFIFKSDVTWDATGIIICGAIVRSEPNLDKGKQYQFYFYRLSGLPAYFIDVYEFGDWKNSITGTKFASDLDVNNKATNQFVLVAENEKLTVYINGVRQGRYYDNSKQRTEGAFAFLAWQQSGEGSCKFENSWVWALK
jgi:hypothetical protein